MCSTPGCRPRREAGHRHGFTLVEVLVALTISGILATAIFQLMQGSARFVAVQSAREEVQQNGRASLDLIAGDLRSLPPSGLQDMRANSVRFYLPRAWGVLCNAVGASSTVAWVLFPAGGLPADFQSAAAHWGVALEQVTDPAVGSGQYRYVRGPQQLAGGSECAAVQPNAAAATRYLTVGFSVTSSLVDTGALGASAVIQPGTQVMVYEETGYDVRRSSSGGPPGIWIRRMSGYSGSVANMQPMAGPLPADTSVVFSYLQADGTSAAAAAQVRQVRVWMEVRSRGQRRVQGQLRPQQVDTMATQVALRNR